MARVERLGVCHDFKLITPLNPCPYAMSEVSGALKSAALRTNLLQRPMDGRRSAIG